MIARSLVEVLPGGRFREFVPIYTDVSVDLQHGTAIAACYIPTFEIHWAGRLNFQISSTTAELSAIWVALEMLLRQPIPTKATFLTDLHCALESIADDEFSMA